MPIPVAVIGVGVVGSAFVHQILSISSPSPYVLVALASSKKLLYNPQGLSFSPAGWKSDLAASGAHFDPPSLVQVLRDHHKKGIWVDNTSNEAIAGLYPAVLRAGFSVVTPNKKAFSGDLGLYEQILRECRESRSGGLDGVRCLHESTVGAGLPILSTLKEMVATGDQVCDYLAVFYALMFG
jgi:homoserine dehydrogenase